MAKVCPEIINFLVFWPRENEIFPSKKICPISLKIYPKNENLPSHRVQPLSLTRNKNNRIRKPMFSQTQIQVQIRDG